eukprot:GHVU01224396.1.p1 GENE.GHVU01224396.1~~GHVU01224396.1.p1  ORF type:complete len:113 (-),score=6.87 GHVU01224396.1:437-775(-)
MALSAVDASQMAGLKRERALKLANYLRLTCAEEFRTTLEQEEIRSLPAEGREATQREIGTENWPFQFQTCPCWNMESCNAGASAYCYIYVYMLTCLLVYLLAWATFNQIRTK